MSERFADRHVAGRALAGRLRHFAYRDDVVLLALPRGGVPVAFEVARELHVPLHVFVVRKLGVPGHEEFAMGAVASGGISFLNHGVIRQLRLSESEVNQVLARERRELQRREQTYLSGRVDLRNKTVILVDDGLATGSTMKAAVHAVREERAAKVIVAVPTAPAEAIDDFKVIADEFVAVITPEVFYAVGEWYDDFQQTTDEEVRALLNDAENLHLHSQSKPVVF